MPKAKLLKHESGLQLNMDALLCQEPLHDGILTPDSPNFSGFLTQWKTSNYFTIDLETTETSTGNGLDARRGAIRLFQILLPDGQLLIVDNFVWKDHPEFLNALKETLANPLIIVVGHNLYFDLSWLLIKYGFHANNIRDTKVMAQIATAGIKTQRYSLSAVHQYLFGESLDKTYQKSDWFQPNLSNAQLNYARLDVVATERCFLRLCGYIRKYNSIPDVFGNPCERSLMDVVRIECDSIPAFANMAYQGYPINTVALDQLISDYENAIKDLYSSVEAKLNLPFSAFPPQLAKAIYDQYKIWLLREKTTKELNADSDDDQDEEITYLEPSLFGNDYPIIPKTHVLTTSSSNLFSYYLETNEEDLLILSLTRSLKKLLDTLYALRDSALQNGGRAITRFNTLGSTSSGRSTSGQDNSSTAICLNLQNLPNKVSHPLLDKYALKPIRYAIQAPPSKKLVILDLSASHSRICAKLSQDSTLVETLSEKDPHLLGTVSLINKLLDTDMTLKEAKARGGKDDKEIGEYRSLFKTFYYLSLNVGSPKRLLAVLNKDFQTSTLELAMACAEAFKATFPQVVEWQSNLHKAAGKTIIDVKVQLKNGRKYVDKYCVFRTSDGRLMHLKAFVCKDRNGKPRRDFKTKQYMYQPSISECTSVSMISPEALLQKQSLKESLELQHENNSFKLIGFCHDELVLEIDDNASGFEAAKQVYEIIARNFQSELGNIPNGMVVTDKNVKDAMCDRYDQK
jgi:DNA polymerase I-like protein with 3'-5' exonuclease and polymerase domains